MSNIETENWIIHSRSNLADSDPKRFEIGDSIELSTGNPVAPAHFHVSRKSVDKLNVNASANVGGTELSFERGSGREARHPQSNKFRGEIRRITLGPTEVLVAVIGHKKSDGTGDDDDTEVVVATRPPPKAD